MKKLTIIIIALLISVSVFTGCNSQKSDTNNETPNPGNPTEIDPSDIITTEFFSFDFKNGTLLGFNETTTGITDIIIPSEIDGYDVRNIAPKAFDLKNLNSVVLPDTLETIGSYSFKDNNLTQIILPDGLTIIEAGAFLQNELIEVSFPNSVTEIGANSFNGNQLIKITLSDNLTIIRLGSFAENNLAEVIIPRQVKIIESNAFRGNLIENIVFNDIIERIDGHAFDTNMLTSITIPASVKSIGIATEDSKPKINYEKFTFADNQLVSITMLGSETDINSFMMGENNHFRDAYNNGGSGTYVGTQMGDWLKSD